MNPVLEFTLMMAYILFGTAVIAHAAINNGELRHKSIKEKLAVSANQLI